MSIKLVIVDDHMIMRQGLCSLLENYSELDVVGEAGNCREAIEVVEAKKPDVILLDVEMPDIDGIETTKKILAINRDCRIIALSMHDQKRYVSEMLAAGASGYLLKESAIEEIVRAIKEVITGKLYLSTKLVDMVVEDYVMRLSPQKASPLDVLTAREKEILKLITEGNNSKEIAAQLNISVKTVDTHRLQITRKLNIHNIAELTKLAIREGLVTL